SGYAHAPSITSVAYSDDHGATWHVGDVVGRSENRGDEQDVYHNPNETEPVELANGHVLFNIRSGSFRHRKLESESPDGVTGWSKPVFVDDLPAPINFASIMRYSKTPEQDKNRLLYSITSSTNIGRKVPRFDEQHLKRFDMAVFVSYDEGRTW